MVQFPSVASSAAETGHDASSRPVLAWSQSRDLREGDNGIEQTVGLIRKAVWQSLSDPWTRMQAATLLRSEPAIPAYNELAKAQRFWQKVYKTITFVDHPIAHQLVQSPQFTVASKIDAGAPLAAAAGCALSAIARGVRSLSGANRKCRSAGRGCGRCNAPSFA